jgi:hypothetical protein
MPEAPSGSAAQGADPLARIRAAHTPPKGGRFAAAVAAFSLNAYFFRTCTTSYRVVGVGGVVKRAFGA